MVCQGWMYLRMEPDNETISRSATETLIEFLTNSNTISDDTNSITGLNLFWGLRSAAIREVY